MTQKDYVILADALRSARNDAMTDDHLRGIAIAQSYIADARARDNAKFDRDRFARAASTRGF